MTYSQKRFAQKGMKRYISDNESINKQLEYLAQKYFEEMQPCDYARIDFILEENSLTPYFLEVNVLMNLGIHGGFVESFLHSHFQTYEDLINHIVKLGLSKIDNNNLASNP